MKLENEPSAWLVPKLMTFEGVRKVHFSRADGCTKTDEELMDTFSGTVLFKAETVFLDGENYYVEDKNGVKHYAEPLYKKLK